MPWWPSACAAMEAGEPRGDIKLPASLPPRCWLEWMCKPQETHVAQGSSTLPLKASGWSKAHRHSRAPLLSRRVGEGHGEAVADLGCLQPPLFLPAPTWPRAAELLEQTRSLGCCQGISSSSCLTPAQSPLGDVGRASQIPPQEPFPTGSPAQPGAGSSTASLCLFSIPKPTLSSRPAVPQRLGAWGKADGEKIWKRRHLEGRK